MQCDCSVDVDGDTAVMFRVKQVKARKQHACCECGDVIEVGESHEMVTGLWDGSWDTYRTCAYCERIRSAYCPGGYYYGELAEQIYECLEFDYRTGETNCEECSGIIAHEDLVCPYCGAEA